MIYNGLPDPRRIAFTAALTVHHEFGAQRQYMSSPRKLGSILAFLDSHSSENDNFTDDYFGFSSEKGSRGRRRIVSRTRNSHGAYRIY